MGINMFKMQKIRVSGESLCLSATAACYSEVLSAANVTTLTVGGLF